MIQNILPKTKSAESTEKRKASFRKETVENGDLDKPLLNKIMTTQELLRKIQFRSSFKKKSILLF